MSFLDFTTTHWHDNDVSSYLLDVVQCIDYCLKRSSQQKSAPTTKQVSKNMYHLDTTRGLNNHTKSCASDTTNSHGSSLYPDDFINARSELQESCTGSYFTPGSLIVRKIVPYN